MKKTSKIESKKSLKTVLSLSTNLPKKRSVQNQANRVLESLVETEVTHSLLETQPPSYDEVCPPSYEESFYYPNIKFKIQPKNNYILDKKESLTEENDKGNILHNNEMIENLKKKGIDQNKEDFYESLFDFNDEFTKMNILFEDLFNEIQNNTNDEKKEEINSAINQKIGLLKKDTLFPAKLEELKNLVCIEMLNTVEILNKYNKHLQSK